MKITAKREAMLAAVQIAMQATGKRKVKPVLECLKVIADNGKCWLIATDLEMHIKVQFAVECVDDGAAILNPKIVSILRESDSDDVLIDIDDKGCTVKTNGKFSMPVLPVTEFPDFEQTDFTDAIQIDAAKFRELVAKTSFAAYTCMEATKKGYTTEGVLIECEVATLTLTATDGSRVASLGTAIVNGQKQRKVVPTRFLDVASLCADSIEMVQLAVGVNNAVAAKSDLIEVRSRLIEGRYPNWQLFVPKEFRFKAKINVGKMSAAIRQAAIMTDTESTKLFFAFTPGKLSISAKGSQSGQSSIDIDVECDGELSMIFASYLFGDMLKTLPPESFVDFQGFDAKAPALVTQGDYLFIAVPMWEGAS